MSYSGHWTGFSVINSSIACSRTRYTRQRKIDNELRVNMKIDSIRAILRLRFHVDIGEFEDRFSVKIATKWIRDGHIKTDDPRQQGKKIGGNPNRLIGFYHPRSFIEIDIDLNIPVTDMLN
jgi:hypothetical protein